MADFQKALQLRDSEAQRSKVSYELLTCYSWPVKFFVTLKSTFYSQAQTGHLATAIKYKRMRIIRMR